MHDNLATIVGAGIDAVAFPEFPAQVQLALAVRLVGLQEEFDPDVDHTMSNIVRAPDQSIIGQMQGTFQIGADSKQPSWLTAVIIPMVVAFVAQTEGTYMIEQDVDGITKAVPIHVAQTPES